MKAEQSWLTAGDVVRFEFPGCPWLIVSSVSGEPGSRYATILYPVERKRLNREERRTLAGQVRERRRVCLAAKSLNNISKLKKVACTKINSPAHFKYMLSNLLRTLLGSEPCIRLILGTREPDFNKSQRELAEACRDGHANKLFIYNFGGNIFYVARYDEGMMQRIYNGQSLVLKPTVEYDLTNFTKKLL